MANFSFTPAPRRPALLVTAPVTLTGPRDAEPSPAAQIGLRFAAELESLKNSELAQDPKALQQAERQLHDAHISALALLAGERGDMRLSRELGSYQSTVNRVRSGAMLAGNPEMLPAGASQDEIDALNASFEAMLYEDLLGDLAEMPGLR